MSPRKSSRKTAKKSSRKTTARSSSRKPSAKKSSARSSRKTSSRSTSLSSAQKKLKDQQLSPWERLKKLGYSSPTIYSFPWEDRGLSSVAKATYVPGIGYVTDTAHELLGDYAHTHYSWESFVSHRVSGVTATPYPVGTHADLFELRDDQVEDVNTIVQAYDAGSPEFLVANGTGTGKTVTALTAVKRIAPSRVLVVCPAAVIPVWRRHIEHMGDDGITFVVINYESLKKTICPPDAAVQAKKTTTQNKHISIDGTPYATFDMVVVDEAHKVKNPTAQQTRLVGKYLSAARFGLKLTATPGKNPAQLHHLWRMLSWNTGDDITVEQDTDLSTYVRWCKNHGVGGIVPAPFGNGITFEGSDEDIHNCEQLIYGNTIHGVVNAMKRIPGSWLPTVRQPYPIAINAQEREAYSLLVDDVKNMILNISKGSRKDMSRGIAAMMRLRQKSGLLKAPYIVDYADYCVKDVGEQVVISTIFHNTADTLSELLDNAKIDHVVITGRDSAQDKEDKRVKFQTGSVPVVVTSITTGISLHQNEESVGGNNIPRRLIVADIHYSPVEQSQLEGRINRNGQHGVITFPVLESTADEQVISRLLEGMRTQSLLQSTGDDGDLEFLADALGVKKPL